MNETSGVNSARLNSAGRLESIARDVESVDASVPILCGVAANRLRTQLGVTVCELPQVTDHPRAIVSLRDRVMGELLGLDPDPIVGEALSLVRTARRHLEEP